MSAAERADERLRLFVALELPEPVRATLVSWCASMGSAPDHLRLLDREALHVTLCFLGWQAATAVAGIAASLDVLAGEPAPELVLGAARWLPRRRPRVLALEVGDPTGALRHAQSAVSRALADGGWYQPETRPYLAHVTVARVGRAKPASTTALPPAPPVRFSAGRVTLFRSRPHRSGARYEPLAGIELGPTPAGERRACSK